MCDGSHISQPLCHRGSYEGIHRHRERCCVHHRVPVPPTERDPLVTHSARGLVRHGSEAFLCAANEHRKPQNDTPPRTHPQLPHPQLPLVPEELHLLGGMEKGAVQLMSAVAAEHARVRPLPFLVLPTLVLWPSVHLVHPLSPLAANDISHIDFPKFDGGLIAK